MLMLKKFSARFNRTNNNSSQVDSKQDYTVKLGYNELGYNELSAIANKNV